MVVPEMAILKFRIPLLTADQRRRTTTLVPKKPAKSLNLSHHRKWRAALLVVDVRGLQASHRAFPRSHSSSQNLNRFRIASGLAVFCFGIRVTRSLPAALCSHLVFSD